MKQFPLGDDKKLIFLKRKYSWVEFKRKARVVPGTYSETFARKTYNSIFEDSINLNREYKKFYQKEYRCLQQFLFWRYGIAENIFNQIPKINNKYLVLVTFDYRINDEETFNASIDQLLRQVDGEK